MEAVQFHTLRTIATHKVQAPVARGDRVRPADGRSPRTTRANPEAQPPGAQVKRYMPAAGNSGPEVTAQFVLRHVSRGKGCPVTRKRLNDQQSKILRWIGQGCPDGEQPGAGYKLSAQALQSRSLAKVSRRQGIWTAELTDDGRHYLEHGDYPPAPAATGVRKTTTAAQPVEKPAPNQRLDAPVETTALVHSSPAKPKVRPAPPPNQGDLLITELLAAGGRIVVRQEYGPGAPSWSARIASAARSKLLPDGKYISHDWIMVGHDTEITLKDIPAWRTEVLAPIVVPERLTNPHPVVAAFRDGKRTLPLTKPVLSRALRLLQALVAESERHGYKARLTPDDKPRYKQGRLQLIDQFTVQTPEVAIGVAISQQNDRVEHDPTARELADAAKGWGRRIPRYDHVPSTRLSIRLTGGQSHWGTEWSDNKAAVLEDALPQILQEMRLRSTAAEAKRKADEEAAALKRRQWEAAISQARVAYQESYKVKALHQQIADWRQAQEIREFLSHAQDVVTNMSSGSDRVTAEEWLAWVAVYAGELDPLAGLLRMPDIPEPSPKDLEPHLKGWTPYSP